MTAVDWLVNCIESKDWGEITTTEELYAKAKEIERQQQDDFAIGFATWYESNSQQREYYPMVEMSIKELLEMYKKEKGL